MNRLAEASKTACTQIEAWKEDKASWTTFLRYERTAARKDTRAGSYQRHLQNYPRKNFPLPLGLHRPSYRAFLEALSFLPTTPPQMCELLGSPEREPRHQIHASANVRKTLDMNWTLPLATSKCSSHIAVILSTCCIAHPDPLCFLRWKSAKSPTWFHRRFVLLSGLAPLLRALSHTLREVLILAICSALRKLTTSFGNARL
jgi:hypothetical protein